MSTPTAEVSAADVQVQEPVPSSRAAGNVVTRVADFAELVGAPNTLENATLDSLLDIKVTATVELGRTPLSIGEVLKLGPGSVLELNRSVSEPVEMYVQGVKLARGEVVVVHDHFAIRIKELAEARQKG